MSSFIFIKPVRLASFGNQESLVFHEALVSYVSSYSGGNVEQISQVINKYNEAVSSLRQAIKGSPVYLAQAMQKADKERIAVWKDVASYVKHAANHSIDTNVREKLQPVDKLRRDCGNLIHGSYEFRTGVIENFLDDVRTLTQAMSVGECSQHMGLLSNANEQFVQAKKLRFERAAEDAAGEVQRTRLEVERICRMLLHALDACYYCNQQNQQLAKLIDTINKYITNRVAVLKTRGVENAEVDDENVTDDSSNPGDDDKQAI